MSIRKKRLLAAMLGIVIALVVGEAGLRLLGISFQDFYEPDPVRGTAHRPGARGWFRNEGRQYIIINSAGFRDREHAKAKRPGTYRIAVLGDSFTEAFQVPLEKSFASVVERELASCAALGGRTVEVLNFGVSDYGTAQELLTLRQRVWDYRPDLVLVAFFTGNDVWDNSKSLKKSPDVPYFELKDGALVLDDSFRRTPRQQTRQSRLRSFARSCVEASRILQLLRQAWGVTVARLRPARGPAQAAHHGEVDASWYQNPIYREPTDPAWRSAWEITERLLIEMRDEATHKGAKFALVTLSNGPQVHPDLAVPEKLAHTLGVVDLFYPDRRLQRLGEKEGFAVLNLAIPCAQYAREHHVFLHGFKPNLGVGHWNEAGHGLAGRLIAGWLCSDVITAGSRPRHQEKSSLIGVP